MLRDKTMNIPQKRCWNVDKPLYVNYHDVEWGVPVHDDQKLFEFLVLDGFQAGLSWWLILERREAFREAFDGFDPAKVAKYTIKDVERIMRAPGVVKNRAKIAAAINNAKQLLKVQKEFGSFDAFIWQFVNGKTIQNAFTKLSDLPAETEESRAISRELKKRGFKFVGPTICYAFMQAAGIVNDHLVDCFRYAQLRR
ncbi:MAG: DNA-3-methyladenine glycosylase I [Candidatus Bathyarchaeia archaeon]|jgi:DNA-3-methyladenine glycosylase I